MQERIESLSRPGAKEAEKARAGPGARWTARPILILCAMTSGRTLPLARLLSTGTPGTATKTNTDKKRSTRSHSEPADPAALA